MHYMINNFDIFKKASGILFFLIISMLTTNAFGQSYDTISIKRNHVLIVKDTIYFGNQDSIIILADTVKYFVTKNIPGTVGLIQDYYRSLFRDTSNKEIRMKEEFKKANSFFEPYEGKIIRHISIQQVDLYEGSVNDTTKTSVTNFGKSINKGSFSTRKWILRQNLRVKKNSELIPSLVSENERLIRGLPYIEDAKFYIVPDSIYLDSVDLILVTKDRFPIGITGSYSNINRFSIEPYTKNFLGFGHTVQPAILYDSNGKPIIGYGGEYIIPNFSGWFVRTKIDFENTYKNERYRIGITKPFVSNDIKYGGGLEYYRQATTLNYKNYYTDSIQSLEAPYAIDYYDFWLGRSFFLEKNTFDKFINVSGRYTGKFHNSRPEITKDSNLVFHDNNMFLFSLSYIQKEYYKTSRLLGYGITEDVPYGYSFSILSGIHYNEYVTRPYLGANASWTRYIENVGYFAYQISAGTFYYENDFEDLKLGSRLIYFSPYKNLANFGLRHFVSPVVTTLYNPKYLPYEDFDKLIRKLKQSDLYGQSTAVIRYEPFFYSKYSFLGFKAAFSLFADVGWITDNAFWASKWNPYAACGLGIYIKNESLTIPTFSIQLGYYPKWEDERNKMRVSFDFRDRELFNNELLGKPELYFDF